MKDINELYLPDEARYTADHEYAILSESGDGTVRIGLSDYAQDQLGDIVFVELPEVGDSVGKGEVFGTVESVKAVAELYMPIGGTVVAINTILEDSPELVNTSPYGEGWMMEMTPADPGDMDALITADAYFKVLKGME